MAPPPAKFLQSWFSVLLFHKLIEAIKKKPLDLYQIRNHDWKEKLKSMFFAQKYLPIWNLKKKKIFDKLIITLKIHKSQCQSCSCIVFKNALLSTERKRVTF